MTPRSQTETITDATSWAGCGVILKELNSTKTMCDCDNCKAASDARNQALGKLAAINALATSYWQVKNEADRCNELILQVMEVLSGNPQPAPDRYQLGDNRRFHWRTLKGGSNPHHEVYSKNGVWAMCFTAERAALVADALERSFDYLENSKACGWRGMAGGKGCVLPDGHSGPHLFSDGSGGAKTQAFPKQPEIKPSE